MIAKVELMTIKTKKASGMVNRPTRSHLAPRAEVPPWDIEDRGSALPKV